MCVAASLPKDELTWGTSRLLDDLNHFHYHVINSDRQFSDFTSEVCLRN